MINFWGLLDRPGVLRFLSRGIKSQADMTGNGGPQRSEDEGLGEDARPAGGSVKRPVSASVTIAAQEPWSETVKTIVYALLIALVIRTLLFQPFVIPSGSMEDTLLIGDYLFVEKYAYGYSNASLPWGADLPGFGRIFGAVPKRGDVAVFKMPNPNSRDYGKDYIKRVIGLPGDRVQMINDRLYINDQIVPQTKAADYVTYDDGYEHHTARFKEFLPDGRTHYILDMMSDGPFDNTDVFVVPPGHYFMMGDNRDNSDDSRAEVGYVPAQALVGKAELIFFSLDDKTDWWQIWNWPWAIRWSRLFTFID